MIMSAGGGLAWAAVQSAAIESAPRRYSGMATGVFTTSANLGGIIGITFTSVWLGPEPTVREFQFVYGAYIVSTLIGTLISTRIESWPTNEDEQSTSAASAPATA